MSEIAERVARGVAALDGTDPDWAYEIDLETLDIQFASTCVAGQLPGGFVETMIRLGLARRDGDMLVGYRMDYEALPEYGFAAHVHASARAIDAEYAELEAEWRRIIIARRAADALAAGK